MHFGSTLRLLRTDAGISVRELARRIGVSSAYVSRVENGWDPSPTPERLVQLAEVLGVSRAALVELARQTGPAVDGYVRRVPAAGALFLKIADLDLDAAQVARLDAWLDREFPSRAARVVPRLDDLVGERVVLGFSGSTVAELCEVAATRLPPEVDPRAALGELVRREERASSCIGGGVVVPHAVLPGAPEVVVVVTTARPLQVDGPDGKPVRVGVVVVGPEPGPRHLEVLSRVARLASWDLASELCAASSAAAVRTLLGRVESLW